MKKTYAIIGAILFIAAVVVGKIAGFDAAVPVSIGLGAFGFAALVAGAVKGSKEKNIPTWQTVVVIIGSTAGGILFFVGGAKEDIMQQISGIVLTLLSIIGGLIFQGMSNQKVEKQG